jgi:hypothetical protein
MPSDACYDMNALAITSVFSRTSDGEILDADVEINARFFTWADVAAGGPLGAGSQDIQNTITHELGHVLGFDHTCRGPDGRPPGQDSTGIEIPDCACFGPNGEAPASPDERCRHATARLGDATMFASVHKGDTTRRDLAEDDIQAVCAVYPAGGDLPCGEPPSGCCALAPAPPPETPGASVPALVLAAAGVARWLRARRGRRPRA